MNVAVGGLHAGEPLLQRFSVVTLEFGLPPYQLCAILGYRPMGQLVAQLDFKLSAVEAALPVELGDVEFLLLFANLIGVLVGQFGGNPLI